MDINTNDALGHDLALIALLMACSAGAVLAALWVAHHFKLDRMANAISAIPGVTVARTVALTLFGSAALAVLLGVVPASAMVQGWGGAVACVAVLGSVVTAGIATSPVTPKQSWTVKHDSDARSIRNAA